jgi:hemerythrin-like domain-containing protein
MVLASLAALERSHRRHDEVIAELLEAARRFAAGRPDAGDLGRVRDAVAYFEGSVTRHFVDEDGSVFPRLSTRRPALAPALAELSAEHPTQITLQTEVAAAAQELDGDARPSAGKTLLDAATRLAKTHHAHVGREDAIFANAHEALTAEDDREIVAEMEMRRDRNGDGRRRSADRPAIGRDATPAAPQPRTRASRATGATTTLTTRRASVAARSSAKRTTKPAVSKPTRPAAARSAKPAATRQAKLAATEHTRSAKLAATRSAKLAATRSAKLAATRSAKLAVTRSAKRAATKQTTRAAARPARRAGGSSQKR